MAVAQQVSSTAPRLTIYGKILNNSTQSVIRDYMVWDPNQVWYYGAINGIKGGESPYVIEFDIWNNEPAFNGLDGTQAVSDATNCTLSVWNDTTLTSSSNMSYLNNMFMQVRCTTNDYTGDFTPIAGPNSFQGIYGNINSTNQGVISGQLGGDHTLLQTKIILPDSISAGNPPLSAGTVGFVFAFGYEFE